MEVFIFVIVVFAIVAFSKLGGGSGTVSGGGMLGGMGGRGSHEAQMTGVARKYGVTLHNTYLIHSGGHSRYDSGEYVYGFSGVDKAGVQVTGQIRVGYGAGSMTFDSSGAGARAARAQGRLVAEEAVDETTLDPEEQVRREVARRLDTLQGNRDAFLANDTDGDGTVDADEWAAARARIEAQVRAELGAAPGQSQPPQQPTQTAAPQPHDVGDGQW